MAPTNPIYQLFGRSPLRPIQEHMDKVHLCVENLIPFFEPVFLQDWQAVKAQQENISQHEKDADQLKHQIRLHLPNGFFLPVARNDLLRMLSLQDRIANKAKDIAGLILGRKMVFPEVIIPSYRELVLRCVDASDQSHQAINELETLLETGFSGKEATLVEGMIQKLDHIEHETDKLQVNVRQELFQIEKNYPPIDMMFLYKIIEYTGDLADRAQRVGGQLQVLLAR